MLGLALLVLVACHHGALAQSRLLSPSSGDARGLVVGIDSYVNPKFPRLSGAVAGARDIADTLRRLGMSDLTVLIDDAATRNSLTVAFDRLIAVSKPGDLVVISFAGHGAQETAPISFSEPDGKDEVIILGGFMPNGDAVRERITDDEIYLWLEQFSRKGVWVLFLADLCHGGGITKAPEPGQDKPAVRGVTRGYSAEEETYGTYFIPERSEPAVKARRPLRETGAANELPGLTFVAGAEAGAEVPEYVLHGSGWRGLASYALARALEGRADLNRDGVVSHRELLRYVRTEVQRLSNHQQNVVTEPRGRDVLDGPVFRYAGATPPNMPARPPAPAKRLSPDLALARGRRPTLPPITLRYSSEDRTLRETSGTIVARGLARDQLSLASDAYQTRRLFMALASSLGSRTLPAEVVPAQGRDGNLAYRLKAPTGFAYVSVLAISALGKVQIVFPLPTQDHLFQDENFELSIMQQGKLLGAETLVVLATHNRPRALWERLKPLAGTLRPEEAFEAILDTADHRTRIGVVRLPLPESSETR